MQWVEGALLCAGLMASAVLAARTAAPRDFIFILPGFGLMATAIIASMPGATFIGLWFAGCAAWALRSAKGMGLTVAAGSCAALAAGLGASHGASWWVVGPLALAVPLVTAGLARKRSGFATAAALDEALSGITLLALSLAAVNPVIDGWHTALALNRSGDVEPVEAAPVWVWIATASALAIGLARGVLKRK